MKLIKLNYSSFYNCKEIFFVNISNNEDQVGLYLLFRDDIIIKRLYWLSNNNDDHLCKLYVYNDYLCTINNCRKYYL